VFIGSGDPMGIRRVEGRLNTQVVVTPPSEPTKELGYFSLVCLTRAHALYGNYYYTSLQP
jgi:hypothetical protein